MKQGRSFVDWLNENGEFLGEPVPGQSLIEIAGDRRVLIENHRGVLEYGRDRIGIRLRLGMVFVYGEGLELMRMTKDQLIISGTIWEIKLERREKA